MRAYYYDLDEFSFAITAPTLKRARAICWENQDIRDVCEGLYINMDLRWIRGARVDDLPEGQILSGIDSLKRGVYGAVYDTCPVCHGEDKRIEIWDGVIECGDCWEKAYLSQNSA